MRFGQSNLYRRWEMPPVVDCRTPSSNGVVICHGCGLTATLSLRQWRLWEDVQRCDSPDQPHLHPDRVWHRHQPWPLWQGEPVIRVVHIQHERSSLTAPVCVCLSGDAHRWRVRSRWLQTVSLTGLWHDLRSHWPAVRSAHSDAVQPWRQQHACDAQYQGTKLNWTLSPLLIGFWISTPSS